MPGRGAELWRGSPTLRHPNAVRACTQELCLAGALHAPLRRGLAGHGPLRCAWGSRSVLQAAARQTGPNSCPAPPPRCTHLLHTPRHCVPAPRPACAHRPSALHAAVARGHRGLVRQLLVGVAPGGGPGGRKDGAGGPLAGRLPVGRLRAEAPRARQAPGARVPRRSGEEQPGGGGVKGASARDSVTATERRAAAQGFPA